MGWTFANVVVVIVGNENRELLVVLACATAKRATDWMRSSCKFGMAAYEPGIILLVVSGGIAGSGIVSLPPVVAVVVRMVARERQPNSRSSVASSMVVRFVIFYS